MCVEIRLEITGIKEDQRNKLTNQIEKHVQLWFCGEKGRKDQQTFVRMISEPRICGCTLIDGAIDCMSKYWNFRSDVLPQIALMIENLGAKAHLHSFQAAWRGVEGPMPSEVHTSIEGLLESIRTNRIRPEVKYLMSKAA